MLSPLEADFQYAYDYTGNDINPIEPSIIPILEEKTNSVS